jgi:hypothetical protein
MLLSLVALVSACASTASTLKTRFAKERSCPASEVAIREEGGQYYRARGCGREAVYVCGASGGFGNPSNACVEQGLVRRTPDREVGGARLPNPDPRMQEPR